MLRDVDLVLVSHLHPDHIDLNPTRVPTRMSLVRAPNDAANLRCAGFEAVTPLETDLHWHGLHITRTAGAHGSGAVLTAMGEVSGFVLRADGEPMLYWAGNTIWGADVRHTLETYQSDVIVTHSGGAKLMGTLIIMDAAQTLEVCAAAPGATVIATHLEAVDHATPTRAALREAARQAGFGKRLLVPEDGEALKLPLGTPTGEETQGHTRSGPAAQRQLR